MLIGEEMLPGYGGTILRINLATGKIRKDKLKPAFAQKWIGGRGFGAKLLWDEVRGVNAFSPDNKLIVAAGPLSGLFVPGAGKAHIVAKSPANEGYGDSNVGGLLATEMKFAGYDVIVIEKRAPAPVYLYIENDDVKLRDAKEYWGRGSITTELGLKRELGDEFQVATIGQGGEKLVRYACITTDYGRQAGRSGMGAVMGSKNLKAIAVRGDKDIPVADMKKLVSVTKKALAYCHKHPNMSPWQKFGTAQVVTWASGVEALPTRNFSHGIFEKAAEIGGEKMVERNVKLNKACFGCPMGCGKYSYIPKYDKYVEGAEYETLALLGSNCGIEELDDILYANYLCDEYGIDTISTGNVIAFAMECAQRGIIQAQLRFGDASSYLEMIRKIAFREDIGNILAEGVRYAGEKFGAQNLALQIKGIEQSGYESRAAPAMALAYMTADNGAHHARAWAIVNDIKTGRDKLEGKAGYVIELQHIRPLFDMLGVCRLQWVELELDLNYYVELYAAATGYNRSLSELLTASERVYNLTRAYWFREVNGFGRCWDLPPPRWREPLPTGTTKGMSIDDSKAHKLLDDYYRLRGWDSDGRPTKEKLKALGLADVAKQIL